MYAWDTATNRPLCTKYETSWAQGEEGRYETEAGSGGAGRLLPSAKDKSRIG